MVDDAADACIGLLMVPKHKAGANVEAAAPVKAARKPRLPKTTDCICMTLFSMPTYYVEPWHVLLKVRLVTVMEE